MKVCTDKEPRGLFSPGAKHPLIQWGSVPLDSIQRFVRHFRDSDGAGYCDISGIASPVVGGCAWMGRLMVVVLLPAS